jgi:hypothetical protein
MPPASSEIAVFPEQRYALCQPRGSVTGSVVAERSFATTDHPDWDPEFSIVWDLTFSPTVDITPGDIAMLKRLASETTHLFGRSRTIIIASRPGVHFAATYYARIMRLFGRDMVCVSSQPEAAELIGVEAIPVLTDPHDDPA